MDAQEQLADIQGRSNAISSTAIRGVQNGYVVTGQVQYADKTTGGVLASMQAEGIASTPEQACNMSLNFHRIGKFDSPQLSFDQTALDTNSTNPLGQPPLV